MRVTLYDRTPCFPFYSTSRRGYVRVRWYIPIWATRTENSLVCEAVACQLGSWEVQDQETATAEVIGGG
jgi:hypothetical protein